MRGPGVRGGSRSGGVRRVVTAAVSVVVLRGKGRTLWWYWWGCVGRVVVMGVCGKGGGDGGVWEGWWWWGWGCVGRVVVVVVCGGRVVVLVVEVCGGRVVVLVVEVVGGK
ncbi:hypothetical protein Pcinc_026158 [Petrolisthes cinctipes]|uniref:Uncharacterized protein n=1 Tax=Petrolisthes cinctipes TaxID=88211 RepID=A0AAE1F770_PETCI|nr:hypothetical protein Pcinc_026158 [Petrolisthes cinctipes]